MGKNTVVHFGKPSYTLKNSTVELFVSVEGGHFTASYGQGKKAVSPYFIAPWWNEKPYFEVDPILQVMRGDYFCFPFGASSVPVNGVKYKVHGKTANDCWDYAEILDSAKEKTLVLNLDLAPDKGSVEKRIGIKKGEPVVYTNHIVKGFDGRMPFGNHPNIQCSPKPGGAILDMSPPLAGFCAPNTLGKPENKGYYLLKPGAEIKDRAKVPTVYGNTVDLNYYPTPGGYEDAVLLISDPAKDFVFTSLAERERGFLYFHLKNPKILAETLLWMPNGGNYNPPFNGRVSGVIGVEEVTGYFFYGRQESIDKNMISSKGYKTTLPFDKDKPTEVKLISGAVPIDSSFKGVLDIVRKDANTITILGRGGEKIDVPCGIDFLL